MVNPEKIGRNPNAPYLFTIGIIGGLTLTAVVLILLFRRSPDDMMLITHVTGFGGTITTGVFALMKIQQSSVSVDALHMTADQTYHLVNNRMDEFQNTLQEAATEAIKNAHAAGRAQGTQEGREAADARTDLLKRGTPE